MALNRVFRVIHYPISHIWGLWGGPKVPFPALELENTTSNILASAFQFFRLHFRNSKLKIRKITNLVSVSDTRITFVRTIFRIDT